ncbi:MAG: tetratricopeptide repeat protein, partial [Candidatus Omnitrophica bacterium]|nr:tetratricopeptide repeat protein [Candidatus Omnitrophota bacterium]
FTWQQISWAQGGQSLSLKPQGSPAGVSGDQLKDISIPKDKAITKEINLEGSDELIINIQDAHDSLSAQYSIVDILDTLVKEYNLNLVALEGSSGYIDTSLLKTFPHKDIRRDTADSLMKEGGLSAGEFFSIVNDKDIKLYGIEDNSLYKEHVAAFCKNIERKQSCVNTIDLLISNLGLIEDSIYPEDIKKLQRVSQDYKAEKIDFRTYWEYIRGESSKNNFGDRSKINFENVPNLKILSESIKLEKQIDFKKANLEREDIILKLKGTLKKADLELLVLKSLQYKLKKIDTKEFHTYLTDLALLNLPNELDNYSNLIKYAEYVNIYERIDIVSLFAEMEEFEETIKQSLFTQDDQRSLNTLKNQAIILKDLFSISLTTKRLEYLLSNLNLINTGAFQNFLKKYNITQDLNNLFSNLDEAIEFYKLAKERDKALINNTLKRMRKDNTKIAALVAGGFHTEGITDILKNKETSYLILVPKFDENAPKRPYVAILTKKTTPYQELLDTGRYQLATSSHFANGVFGINETLSWVERFVEAAIRRAHEQGLDLQETANIWINAYRTVQNNLRKSKEIQEGVLITPEQVEAIINECVAKYSAQRSGRKFERTDAAERLRRELGLEAPAPAPQVDRAEPGKPAGFHAKVDPGKVKAGRGKVTPEGTIDFSRRKIKGMTESQLISYLIYQAAKDVLNRLEENGIMLPRGELMLKMQQLATQRPEDVSALLENLQKIGELNIYSYHMKAAGGAKDSDSLFEDHVGNGRAGINIDAIVVLGSPKAIIDAIAIGFFGHELLGHEANPGLAEGGLLKRDVENARSLGVDAQPLRGILLSDSEFLQVLEPEEAPQPQAEIPQPQTEDDERAPLASRNKELLIGIGVNPENVSGRYLRIKDLGERIKILRDNNLLQEDGTIGNRLSLLRYREETLNERIGLLKRFGFRVNAANIRDIRDANTQEWISALQGLKDKKVEDEPYTVYMYRKLANILQEAGVTLQNLRDYKKSPPKTAIEMLIALYVSGRSAAIKKLLSKPKTHRARFMELLDKVLPRLNELHGLYQKAKKIGSHYEDLKDEISYLLHIERLSRISELEHIDGRIDEIRGKIQAGIDAREREIETEREKKQREIALAEEAINLPAKNRALLEEIGVPARKMRDYLKIKDLEARIDNLRSQGLLGNDGEIDIVGDGFTDTQIKVLKEGLRNYQRENPSFDFEGVAIEIVSGLPRVAEAQRRERGERVIVIDSAAFETDTKIKDLLLDKIPHELDHIDLGLTNSVEEEITVIFRSLKRLTIEGYRKDVLGNIHTMAYFRNICYFINPEEEIKMSNEEVLDELAGFGEVETERMFENEELLNGILGFLGSMDLRIRILRKRDIPLRLYKNFLRYSPKVIEELTELRPAAVIQREAKPLKRLELRPDAPTSIRDYVEVNNRLFELEGKVSSRSSAFDMRLGESQKTINYIRTILSEMAIEVTIEVLQSDDPRIRGRTVNTLGNNIYFNENATRADLWMYIAHEVAHISREEKGARIVDIEILRRTREIAQTIRAVAENTQGDISAFLINMADAIEYQALYYELDIHTARLQTTEEGRRFLDQYQLGKIENTPPDYVESVAASLTEKIGAIIEVPALVTTLTDIIEGQTVLTEDLRNKIIRTTFRRLLESPREKVEEESQEITDILERWVNNQIREAEARTLSKPLPERLMRIVEDHNGDIGKLRIRELEDWFRDEINRTADIDEKAQLEQIVSDWLFNVIKENVSYDEDFFELRDALGREAANCFGFAQVFTAFASKFGLAVGSVHVFRGPQGEIFRNSKGNIMEHMCNILMLSDGRKYLVDLTIGKKAIRYQKIKLEVKESGKWKVGYVDARETQKIEEVRGLPKRKIEAAIYGSRGKIHAEKREFDRAIENFNKAIELDPELTLAYSNRGVAYAGKSEFDNAFKDFNKAIELDPEVVIAYVARGSTYVKIAGFDKAIENFTKALELDPVFFSVYVDRGKVYVKIGEFDKAIEDFTRAIELNPKLAEAYTNRGYAYMERGELDKAMTDFNKVIELNPSNSMAYNNRGAVYTKQEEYAKAIADFTKALELNPNNEMARDNLRDTYLNQGKVYMEAGELNRATECFNKVIELDPSNSMAYNNRGSVYGTRGEFAKAIEDFTKALELDPNNGLVRKNLQVIRARLAEKKERRKPSREAITHNERGIAYVKTGEFDEAIAHLNVAIELDPKFAQAYTNRGLAYVKKGELDRAMEDFNKAIELNSSSVMAYNNRGGIYAMQAEYAQAIADFTRALELDPDNKMAQDNLRGAKRSKLAEERKPPEQAVTYFDRGVECMDLGEYDEAIENFTRAIELDPEVPPVAYNNRAIVYMKIGEYKKALEDFTRALELDPDDKMVQRNLGIVREKLKKGEGGEGQKERPSEEIIAKLRLGVSYLNKGDLNKAIKVFTEIITPYPNYAAAYLNRGVAYARLKDFDMAIKDFDKAIGLNPSYVQGYVNRGIAYMEKGKYAKAIKDLTKALELDPNDEDARAYLNSVKLALKIDRERKGVFGRLFGRGQSPIAKFIGRGEEVTLRAKGGVIVRDGRIGRRASLLRRSIADLNRKLEILSRKGYRVFDYTLANIDSAEELPVKGSEPSEILLLRTDVPSIATTKKWAEEADEEPQEPQEEAPQVQEELVQPQVEKSQPQTEEQVQPPVEEPQPEAAKTEEGISQEALQEETAAEEREPYDVRMKKAFAKYVVLLCLYLVFVPGLIKLTYLTYGLGVTAIGIGVLAGFHIGLLFIESIPEFIMGISEWINRRRLLIGSASAVAILCVAEVWLGPHLNPYIEDPGSIPGLIDKYTLLFDKTILSFTHNTLPEMGNAV